MVHFRHNILIHLHYALVSMLLHAIYSSLDHLAIENNKDADPAEPYWPIWRHDIWGKVTLNQMQPVTLQQDMRENDSHRSFRPLLITLFRFVRCVVAYSNLSYF